MGAASAQAGPPLVSSLLSSVGGCCPCSRHEERSFAKAQDDKGVVRITRW